MSVFRTQEEAYDRCVSEGNLKEVEEVDIQKIKSNIKLADEELKIISEISKLSIQSENHIYKTYYDVLHALVEAFLCFDKIRSLNHQCLFSYLCVKHKKLEFDWSFFEKVRTKRNGINYYGALITREDVKEIELQMRVYVSTLKREINRKIKEFEN